ncbi:hypothetical protein [Turicibacter sp.]|uniref:hypothetical protein n=1 Tax=Turicibacter sp. TaxID=2049042 RepID=UPI001B770472|nr:hypothetical protein [Turicibacter sp.]MBP3903565.1 hypothetical protein [Turicibacter sp.]MBP3908092.1 hypothetical protein [Turicibacter sp.]
MLAKETQEPKAKARSIYAIHEGADSWIATSQAYPHLKLKGERHWFQHHELGYEAFQAKVVRFHNQENKFNSYFSVNSFSRPQRSTATLFRLNALYVDLDWHGKSVDYQVVLRVLEDEFLGTKVPFPTHITFTGRGLQLFWQLEHAPKQALNFWMMIESLLADELSEISDYLPSVNVDHSCTTVDQVMRQPNSWHVTAKTYARELDLPYLYEYQYTLKEIADDYFMHVWDVFDKNHAKKLAAIKRREEWSANQKLKKADKKAYEAQKKAEREAKNQKKKKIKNLFNGHTLMVNRLEDLYKLLELRDYDIRGCRDTFFFFYAWTFATEHTTLQHITSELLGVNSLLKYPLTEAEIEAKAKDVFNRLPRVKQKLYSNSTEEEIATLKANSKKGKVFRGFRNSTMINRLGITREEQKHMKTLIDKREKYDRNNERRRAERRDKNNYTQRERKALDNAYAKLTMYEPYLDQGFGAKRIAKELNMSLNTVKSDLKRLKEKGLLI